MAKDTLVRTLSDDDVSDEEFSEPETTATVPTPASSSLNGTKRKRSEPQTSQNVSKKQKQDIADGDLESDFEFDVGDRALEDLDAWAVNGDGQEEELDTIEAIVARRRPQAKAPMLSEELSEGDDISGDEANEDEEDEDDVDEDEDAEEDSGDEEDEAVARVVPHPDDVDAEDEDGEGDGEEEDAVETAKRDAFFAKDDVVSKTMITESDFLRMNLSRPILKGLTSVGFSKPTPIQAKTIPVALEGKDVVGGAVTGSGKTAAFLIPILERLLFRSRRTATTRVVILMPTRELALQCFNVAKKLAAFTDITFGQAIGGLNMREQEKQLKLRPDIVIATPGRFIDIERNSSSFAANTIEVLVLDEADRMLEEGFADELNEILTKIPKSRQTMLFSATMTSKVDDLIRVGLQRPVRVMVDAQKQTVSGLIQEFVRLRPGRESKRLAYLMYLCTQVHTDRAIIFFRQKKDAHRIHAVFALCNLRAAELHGSMSQEQRITAIETFRTGRASFLLATDLASRGLDIRGIDVVLNYEAPQTHEIYLHRVGRTARAGRSGRACTLAAEPDRKVVKAAVKSARAQGAAIRQRAVPVEDVEAWAARLEELEPEVEAVLREEKEARALDRVDRDLTRADNLVKYEDEIRARPKKTWFSTEKDKAAAREKGAVALNGEMEGGRKAGKKGKLSNKEKKSLRDKDDRRAGQMGKKKHREDRLSGELGKVKTKPKVKGKAKGKKK